MRKLLVLAALFFAFLLLPIAEVFAISPVTVNSSSQAAALDFTSNRLLCYSNGYYFQFETQSSTNLVYQSSQTGASWSAVSAAITTSLSSAGSAGIYCDNSGNIYATWGISATQFQYRLGTSTAGVITWSFAAITLTCNNGGLICGNIPSIYAFDTTHVWLAMDTENGAGTRFGEVWACLTSACSTVGNWANKLSDSSAKCPNGCIILGLSSASNLAYVANRAASDIINIRTTSNSGVSWSAAVATTDANGYSLKNAGCVSISSTVYCAAFDGVRIVLKFLSFVQGAGAWTETTIATLGSAAPAPYSTISTDKTNMFVAYGGTASTTIDYQTSKNVGATWSGDAIWVSGEATAMSLLTSTPTLQSGSAGVSWQIATSNNIRFATSAAIIIPDDSSPNYLWILLIPVVILVLLIKRRI